MANPFEGVNVGLSAPGVGIVDVTPNDSVDLPGGTCRALYCLAAGTVAGVTADGEAGSTELFVQGQVLSVGWTRILSAGTTATVQAIY